MKPKSDAHHATADEKCAGKWVGYFPRDLVKPVALAPYTSAFRRAECRRERAEMKYLIADSFD